VRRFRVVLSPEAERQVAAIEEWWRANRAAAPELFLRELSAAIRHLGRAPFSGRRYEAAGSGNVRRVPMSRTRYHVYYRPDELSESVKVLAVWHMSRGEGPPL